MLDAARLHIPDLPAEPVLRILRYELPLSRAGDAMDALSTDTDAGADHRPGSLRVSVLQAQGLPMRCDGSACEPSVAVTIAELTRRRTQRTVTARGATVGFNESFEFDSTSACAQVVVDVWDHRREGPSDLLGKIVLGLTECRPGIPHTHFKHLLKGKLVCPLPTYTTRFV